MTDVDDPGPGQEGYWSALDGAGDGGDPTVRQLVLDALGGVETVHAVTATHRTESTVYLVVTYSTTMQSVDTAPDLDVPVVDLRTVAVDLDAETVTATDNGLWVPADGDVAHAATKALARATTDLSNDRDDEVPPARMAADGVDVDVDLVLDRTMTPRDDGQNVDRMAREPGIDPARPWGYGADPPPEIDRLVERFGEAGLDPSDHVTRLKWGTKEPMDRTPRPVAELAGNYGVETRARDEGFIAVDVDYPEAFPDDHGLPETFAVTSPHGDDDRRHLLFYCQEKETIAREVGAWAVQSVEWGDLWIGDRYVVGPGSQLSAYGCDNGDHTVGDEAACSACMDPDAGYYRIVEDEPLAEVTAADVLGLLDGSEGYVLRDEPTAPDPPETDADDGEPELADHEGRCASCGAVRPTEDLKTVEVLDSERRICRGGCDA